MKLIDTDIIRNILSGMLFDMPASYRDKATQIATDKLKYVLHRSDIPTLPELEAAENARMEKHLKELESEGLTMLGEALTKQQIEDIKNYLDKKNLYNGHVWLHSDNKEYTKQELLDKKVNQASYVLSDVLEAPHILKTISDPFLLKLAEKYIGVTPSVYQANIMWSKDNGGIPTVAQNFHRDWDNLKFCVLFIYLTDVDGKKGPHQYIKKSHRTDAVNEAVNKYNSKAAEKIDADLMYKVDTRAFDPDLFRNVFGDDVTSIEKPAGYAFFVDPFGLHQGLPLIEGERLLLWCRFGLYDSGFSLDVGPVQPPFKKFTKMVKDTVVNRYIFRAILKTEFTSTSEIPLHNVPNFFETRKKPKSKFFGKFKSRSK